MDHYFLPAGVSDWPKGGILRFDMSPTHPLAREMMAELDITPPYLAWWRRFRHFFRK